MGAIVAISGWVGIIGAVGLPLLADKYGRKPMMNWSILGFTVGTAATGLVQNGLQLGIVRSLTRIPLAGETTISYMMVAESMPTKWRSIFLSVTNSFYPLGYAIGVAIAAWGIAAFGWRGLFLLGIVPSLLVVLLRFKLKESPRFEVIKAERTAGTRAETGFVESMITPWQRYPSPMRIAAVTNTLYTFIWLGWSTWMPTWLIKVVGLDLATSAAWQGIWMMSSIPGYWICAMVCQKIGKKRGIPLFIVPGGLLLIAAMFPWDLQTTFLLGLVLNILVTASYGSGSATYSAELFPTYIRGAALASLVVLGQVIGWGAPWVMGVIGDNFGLTASFILPAVACLIVGPVFLWFAPETINVDLPEDNPTDAAITTPLEVSPAPAVAQR